MLHHLIVFYLVVDCCLFGSFACAFVRPFRVDDETFVTVSDAELDAELISPNVILCRVDTFYFNAFTFFVILYPFYTLLP